MRTKADQAYTKLINQILMEGEEVTTRNHNVIRHTNVPNITFDSAPIVTLRSVAIRKALLEMEWFLSGDDKCPDHLKDWWEGQLNEEGLYIGGYAHQLIHMFDQIDYIIEGLKNNPYSRRLCFSAWCTEDMANITYLNGNPNTPSTCHLSFVQVFVDTQNKVHMKQYQRSCDVLLGLPHNWIQHHALLVYLARQSGREVGTYTWIGGDVHIYDEPSHMEVAKTLANINVPYDLITTVNTEYLISGNTFLAEDFAFDKRLLDGPIITTRPKLL